jgi:hypothetical protein
MWSPEFEENPNSPAGEMQAFWRLTGRGSDALEVDARERARQVSRVGRFILRLLGYRPLSKSTGRRRLDT